MYSSVGLHKHINGVATIRDKIQNSLAPTSDSLVPFLVASPSPTLRKPQVSSLAVVLPFPECHMDDELK